jgi:hydrogenase maturation protease
MNDEAAGWDQLRDKGDRGVPTAARPHTLVIGLGNPLLGDDGVGWHVAEQVRRAIGDDLPDVEIECLAVGGLSLMERMVGYEWAIVIDALESGKAQGTVQVLPLAALPEPEAGHLYSAHDTSFRNALRVGSALGAPLPSRVTVVGIEACCGFDFTETLSPAVSAAIPEAVQAVIALLRESGEKDEQL